MCARERVSVYNAKETWCTVMSMMACTATRCGAHRMRHNLEDEKTRIHSLLTVTIGGGRRFIPESAHLTLTISRSVVNKGHRKKKPQ